jgi:hypothetical protein
MLIKIATAISAAAILFATGPALAKSEPDALRVSPHAIAIAKAHLPKFVVKSMPSASGFGCTLISQNHDVCVWDCGGPWCIGDCEFGPPGWCGG